MKTRAEAVDELLSRTEFIEDGCWEWQGSRMGNGYGEIRADGGYLLTHRLAYEHFIAPIPPKFVVDHLCRNERCWRLDHIEAVTHGENLRRGYESRGNPEKCRNGHDWEGNRRMSRRGNGSPFSQCKACDRDRWRAKKQAE